MQAAAEIDAAGNVAPLVVAGHLQGAIVAPGELGKVERPAAACS